MKRYVWFIIAAVFLANTAFQTWLAWDGDHFPLITLAVTVVFFVALMTVYQRGWRESLEGWGRSTAGWGAAQEFAMKQDEIIRDAVRDLEEYDEEAAAIHSGRARNAALAYVKTFGGDE